MTSGKIVRYFTSVDFECVKVNSLCRPLWQTQQIKYAYGCINACGRFYGCSCIDIAGHLGHCVLVALLDMRVSVREYSFGSSYRSLLLMC